MLAKQIKRIRRHKRVRARVVGTAKKPRLAVFRSGLHIYAQLVDDEKGRTLASVSDLKIDRKSKKQADAKTVKAKEVGKMIAQKAIEQKIKEVVFDRGGFKYHGRVKALSEAAREAGLKF